MSQRRYAANHFTSCRWVASCKLRRATCNRQPSQTARRTSHVASLCPGLWTDHRQRRRRLHVARRTSHHCAQGYGLCTVSDVADCTSQIAARRIDARHVRMVSTELLGLAANPRAAIREPQSASCGPVASRSSQIAARSIEARHVLRHDCSSHGTARSSQTVAQAVLFLRSQRAPRSSQGADFRAGSTGAPLPVLARPQPALSARNKSYRESMAGPIFSSRRIADRTVADRST